MLDIIFWKNLTAQEQKRILQRPAVPNFSALQKTQEIIAQVRNEGDVAIKRLTQFYDKVALNNLSVNQADIIAAETHISIKAKNALQRALQQLQAFHQKQLPENIKLETSPGIVCEMQFRAIENVGFYIPGGTAKLPSTVLMLGVPGKIAGCPRRILCTPPREDGSIDPHILYAAKLCDIQSIYKIGGAQAIAAMAYGTESIPKVDKIFGPGNSWVTLAKILVSQDPNGASYDLPAGPTEQMVIADSTANPEFIAADLLSQAEHGVDSQVMLVCDNTKLVEAINQKLSQQITHLPRKAIAEIALKNGRAIITENISQAIEIANQYAPKHLILNVSQPQIYIAKIQSAGSVFLGPWAPESVGDYASGTNHVLPTYGYAKNFSGLGVTDFMKRISFQELSLQGLQDIAEAVETLAEIEGLEAHKRAVSIRLRCHPE